MNDENRPDLGRELIRTFGDKPFPYVPAFAIDALHVTSEGAFATQEVDARRLYAWQDGLDDLLGATAAPAYAVSFWGHGINSYAWTVLLRRPGLRVLAQCGYGGAFPSPDQDAQLAEVFALVRALDGLVPEEIERDVVVMVSPLRSICSVGLAPAGGASREEWMDAHRVTDEDVLAEVDELLAPPGDPEYEWSNLVRAFEHAVIVTSAVGLDHDVIEDQGRLLMVTADEPGGAVRATIMTYAEDADEPTADEVALMCRLGWKTSAELRNLHIDVDPDAPLVAAQAMADAVRWLWRMHPAKAAHWVYRVVGGEEGDLSDVD